MNSSLVGQVKAELHALFMDDRAFLRKLALENPSLEEFQKRIHRPDFRAEDLEEDFEAKAPFTLYFPEGTTRAILSFALWTLARELYMNPNYDRADLSAWLDNGLPFRAVKSSRVFLAKNVNNRALLAIKDSERLVALGAIHV